jgi:drug/metabolite transporter (DMT)-like permease
MIFIISVLNMLLASTFIIGKLALEYVHPFLLIGVRMVIGGSVLLAYQYFFKHTHFFFHKKDWWLFAQAILFHIYLSFMLEFWALDYVSSAKTCLFFSLSPFVTAILCYFLFSERLTIKQLIGLVIGFLGFLPELLAPQPVTEISAGGISFISFPEIALLFAMVTAAYGWVVVKQLVVNLHYPAAMVNGIAMFFAGILSLITSFIWSGWPTVKAVTEPTHYIPIYLVKLLGAQGAGIALFLFYTSLLILVANIIYYNLYGVLLKKYSATFLSFAGFTAPLFTAVFGWIFLGESVSWHFIVTNICVVFGLYLFYIDELKSEPIYLEK